MHPFLLFAFSAGLFCLLRCSLKLLQIICVLNFSWLPSVAGRNKSLFTSHLRSAMGTGLVHAAGGILQKYRAQSWWKRGVPSAQGTKVTPFPSWRLPQVAQLSHTWELPRFMPIKANQLSLKSFILEGVSLFLLQMEEGYKSKGTIGD